MKLHTNNTNTHQTRDATPHKGQPHRQQVSALDARNHYPQIKHHTPPPKQGSNQNPRNTYSSESRHLPHTRGKPAGLLPQDPTVCLAISSPTRFPFGPNTFVVHPNHTHYR